MGRPIIIERLGENSDIGLYVESDKVIFEYNSLFDADTDDQIHAYGIIPVENYKIGIQWLREWGRCSIKGDDCLLKLNIRKDGKIQLDFSGAGFANNVFAPELNWDIEHMWKPFESD